MDNKDFLDGWREEVGIKNSKGEIKHYEGGCESDPTADAIREYMRQEALKEKAEKAKKAEAEELGL